MILVDTKYEFGVLDGEVVLIDEVHTPDSSRFWYADTYEELFADGKDQRALDKEPLPRVVRRTRVPRRRRSAAASPTMSGSRPRSRYIALAEEITQRAVRADGGDRSGPGEHAVGQLSPAG